MWPVDVGVDEVLRGAWIRRATPRGTPSSCAPRSMREEGLRRAVAVVETGPAQRDGRPEPVGALEGVGHDRSVDRGPHRRARRPRRPRTRIVSRRSRTVSTRRGGDSATASFGSTSSTKRSCTSGSSDVRPQAIRSLCPMTTPGTPGSVAPVARRPGASIDARYQTDGVRRPRCGSLARIGLPLAVREPPSTQELLPRSSPAAESERRRASRRRRRAEPRGPGDGRARAAEGSSPRGSGHSPAGESSARSPPAAAAPPRARPRRPRRSGRGGSRRARCRRGPRPSSLPTRGCRPASTAPA